MQTIEKSNIKRKKNLEGSQRENNTLPIKEEINELHLISVRNHTNKNRVKQNV